MIFCQFQFKRLGIAPLNTYRIFCHRVLGTRNGLASAPAGEAATKSEGVFGTSKDWLKRLVWSRSVSSPSPSGIVSSLTRPVSERSVN